VGRSRGKIIGRWDALPVEEHVMLEEKEQVVALLKEAMKELGLNRKGHVEFHPLLPDSVGLAEPYSPTVWRDAPRWVIKLQYPTDGEGPAAVYSFQVNTSEFRDEEEVKNFMAGEIKRQM
jgi:hypothetical protein